MTSHLCENPACRARERDFEHRSIFGEDCISEILRCSLCEDEVSMEDWHSRRIQHQQMLPELRCPLSVGDSDDGQNFRLDFTKGPRRRKKSQVLFPETYEPIERQNGGELTLEQICDVIDYTPCQNCTHTTTKVSGGDGEDNIMVWYCEHCGHHFGLDDTYSAVKLAEILILALENDTPRCEPCGMCSNDDPNKFIFSYDSEHGIGTQCLICKPSNIENIQNELIQSRITCDCGNAKKDLFRVDMNNFDDIRNVECLVCRNTINLEKLRLERNSTDDEKYHVACNCGNTDLKLFEVHTNENGDPHTLVCCLCDNELRLQLPERRSFSPPKGRTEITSMGMLRRGDHIKWESMLGYTHHAIITGIDKVKSKVKCINYSGPDSWKPRGIIREDKKSINCKRDAVYREDYDECHPAEVVIQRAISKLKETKYNPFWNNCEHFAQWCKTGIHFSEQVKNLKDFTIAAIKEKLLPLLSKDTLKQGINIIKFCKSALAKPAAGVAAAATKDMVGEAGATTFNAFRQAASGVGRTIGKLDIAASVVVIAIEVGSVAKDIYDLRKQKKSGDISSGEFVRCSIKRVVEGLGTSAGSVGGSILGQLFIPVPVIGGLIGNVVGTFVCKYAARLIGRTAVKLYDGK